MYLINLLRSRQHISLHLSHLLLFLRSARLQLLPTSLVLRIIFQPPPQKLNRKVRLDPEHLSKPLDDHILEWRVDNSLYRVLLWSSHCFLSYNIKFQFKSIVFNNMLVYHCTSKILANF